MSVNKNIYVVFGYDLSDHYDELLTEEFHDSDLYEEWAFKHRAGQIQIFTDPMSGDHLYLGCIAAKFEDGYEDQSYITTLNNFDTCKEMVDVEAATLPEVWRERMAQAKFSLIAFTEYT